MQYILSDNGANVKRALLDLGKLEVTAKDEPLICGDDDDIDDDDIWTTVFKESYRTTAR